MTLTDLFFVYGSELPSDVGYPMFGLVHILWLVAGALLIFLIALLYAKQKSSRGRRRLDIGIGSFFLFLIRQTSVCFLNSFLRIYIAIGRKHTNFKIYISIFYIETPVLWTV